MHTKQEQNMRDNRFVAAFFLCHTLTRKGATNFQGNFAGLRNGFMVKPMLKYLKAHYSLTLKCVLMLAGIAVASRMGSYVGEYLLSR